MGPLASLSKVFRHCCLGSNLTSIEQSTQRRTALRIAREAELLGGQLNATHTREGLVLSASFLRSDLPYFAELLAEVTTLTKYTSKHIIRPRA